jgi:hypothetical protein
MNVRLKTQPSLLAACAILIACGSANADIVARFDIGDTTGASVQAGFTSIGAAGATPAAYAGPQNATVDLVTLRLAGGTTLAAATAKDGSGNFNSTGSLVARNRNVPAADVGSFTYSDIYRDFVTANVLGIQLSGLGSNANHAITFYVYDNSGSRTQTFTNVTPGGTGSSGSVTYTAASTFADGTSNEIFATTINATSDSSGRLFFTVSGTGNTNVGIVGGIVVDALAGPSFPGFHHAYDGNFNDSSVAGNDGTAAGTATITTDPEAIISGTGSLALDGADESFVTLETPGAFSETSPWTATWWAKRGEIGLNKGMVMGLAGTTSDFIWLNDNFTGLRFRSTANTTLNFTSPKDQEIRHYALVADGAGNLSLYLDGILTQTLTGNTSFAMDTIGKAYPTTSLHYNFQGTLDEVHVFNSALSAGQIATLYDEEKPGPPVTRLRIVLVAGQSNADGRAVVTELPTSPVNLQNPQNDVDLFYQVEGGSATLTTLRPGLTETSQFGPDILLGRRLADLHQSETGTRVVIIKYANGGTNLATQWKGGGDATTTGDGVDYVTFQQTVTQGLAALAAAYPLATLDLQSIVWLQGESDAVTGLSAAYQANLTNFIADVRATYGSSLPFVIARLSSAQTALSTTHLNAVRAAQDAVAAVDPRTAIFSTDSFGIKTDNLHFNGSGQQSIGSAFAEETAYYEWMIDTFSPADINAGLAEPGADLDGDGQSNRTEFLGLSNPLSGTSGFKTTVDLSVPAAVSISYASSVARVYSVQQYNEVNGTWETILPALQGTGETVVRSVGAMETRSIFRVRSDLP